MKNINNENITLFRKLFSGLGNVYGTYNPISGQVNQIKAPVTDKVISLHLQGKQPYGVYLLVKDHIRAIAVDFDDNDQSVPVEFVNLALHYCLPAYIERSKSKGYHVWIFFSHPVKASKARLVVRFILEQINKPYVEIFPKQDELNTRITFGNFINAPLFGALISKERTVFVNPDNGMKPYPDQWDFLKSIRRVTETVLDEIIEVNELKNQSFKNTPMKSSEMTYSASSFGLPPCAQKMLREGVGENQRIACFRLAIHLKKAGFPFDLAVATLNAWSAKNKPSNGKQIITQEEIFSQTKSAYEKDYRGFGCEDPAISRYCNHECMIIKKKKAQ